MKKLLSFIILASILVGCGSKKDVGLKDTDVQVNNQIVSLDQNMSEVVKGLGKDYRLDESKSCMFDGNDKTYTYTSIVINTYPKGEDDFVNSITLLDNSSQFNKDIHIGDSLADVKKVIKDQPVVEDEQSCSYEFGQYGYTFYLENQKVIEIELYLLQK